MAIGTPTHHLNQPKIQMTTGAAIYMSENRCDTGSTSAAEAEDGASAAVFDDLKALTAA